MEFDPSYAGAVDWSFPSPTATPSTANFGHGAIQTPKTAVPFPTHFQDAFNTPQLPGYVTPHHHGYTGMTPGARPQGEADMGTRHPYGQMPENTMQNMHLQGEAMTYSMPHAGPPPMQDVQMQSFVGSFSSSQMQTPPPTRGASSKKPYTHHSQHSFGTPSTIASRRFTTPQNQEQQALGKFAPQHHPQNAAVPQLHLSPEGLPFGNFGPASAPVMSQTHILWGQPGSPNQFPQQKVLEDPFAPSGNQAAPWSILPSQQADMSSFDSSTMRSFPVQAPHSRSSSNLPFGVPFSAGPAIPTVIGSVDPSLVYSSPVRPLVRSNSYRNKPRPEAGAPLKRKDSTTSLRSDVNAASVNDETNPTGPGLRRSSTMSSLRTKSNLLASGLEQSGRNNTLREPPRTASPLKRIGKLPLGRISEDKPRLRPAIVLTVDETGRARAEARKSPGTSPTSTLRERYPGLYDSDSSEDEDESDVSEIAPSRAASFSLAHVDERRSKVAKHDGPVEGVEGLSILRSASATSLRHPVAPSRAALAAAAQLRRNGSLRRSGSIRTLQRRRSVLTNGANSMADANPALGQHSAGGVAQQRLQPHRVAPEVISPASTDSDSQTSWLGDAVGPFDQTLAPAVNLSSHANEQDRRWSVMSFDQSALSMPAWSFQAPMATLPSQPLPPSGSLHHSQSFPPPQKNPLIQCFCGVSDHSPQPLIQCSSCSLWHHSFCVGVHAPANFTCMMCTRPAGNNMVPTQVGWA